MIIAFFFALKLCSKINYTYYVSVIVLVLLYFLCAFVAKMTFINVGFSIKNMNIVEKELWRCLIKV
jgi:hypothetical protein